MLSSEILKQIRKIQIKAGHLVTDALVGSYISVFRGRGMEFDQVREYTPGDDVRTIDWNVTARMGAPFVKIFREERELTLILMIDVSGSQAFGTDLRMKKEATAELSAVLAYVAKKNQDRVGLLLFSDHVEKYIPPKKGRSHIWAIIKEILSYEAKAKSTNIESATNYLLKVLKRRCTVFLISDFLAQSFEQSLSQLKGKHHLVCVPVHDQRELVWPKAGMVTVGDAETGRQMVIDSSSKAFQKSFAEFIGKRQRDLRQFFRSRGIEWFDLDASESVVEPLTRFLALRERRRR